jgi:lysophospholipase L1-like esterase
MALDRIRMLTGDLANAVVVPGDAGPVVYLPAISGAPTADPGDVVNGSAVAVSNGRATVTTQNPSVVSRLPSAMAIWEFSLVDLFGDTINDADDFDLADLFRAFVFADTTAAPDDVIIAVGFSAGAVNTTNVGCCAAIQAAAGRWLAHHGSNAGAGWSLTAASADSALTRGAMVQAVQGTGVSQARINAVPVDATGEPISTANTSSSPSTVTSQAGYDRLFVGIGWATGSGGTGAAQDVGASALLLRLQEVPEIVPFELPSPSAFPAVVRRIAVLGHSMARCTVATSDDGAAIPAGWTVRLEGANVANWPATSTGIKADLVAAAIAGGAVSGDRYLICRSTPGSSIGAQQDGHLAGVRDDVATLGLGDPDALIIWIGANDAQDAAEFAQISATTGFERLVRLARHEFPNTPIYLLGERTTDAGTYPYVDDGQLDAERQAIATAIPYVRFVSATSPSGITLTDAIHPDDAGYQTMADRIESAWLGP